MKHIKLFENFLNENYTNLSVNVGDILSKNDIYNYIEKLHRNEEDFTDGDIAERIEKFDKYIVTEISIDKINMDEYYLDEDYVDEYIEKYKNLQTYPPIVLGYYDNKWGYDIIDGTHRANSLRKLGVKSIISFVGLNELQKLDDIIQEKEFTNKDIISLGKDYEKFNLFKINFYKKVNLFKQNIKNLIITNKLRLKYDFGEVSFIGKEYNEYKIICKEYAYILNDKLNTTTNHKDSNIVSNGYSFTVNVEVGNFNRTHFNGILSILKGIDLGYYIYKFVAKTLGFLSSEEDSTVEVKRIWERLIRDKDFYSFYIKLGYNKYKIGIIYKPMLNEIKEDFVRLMFNYYINRDIILDDKFSKDLYFDDKNYEIVVGELLKLFNINVSTYNSKTKKWVFDKIVKGTLGEIIKRDSIKYLKFKNLK